MKVAVLGYNNANIKGWLGEEVWSGMHFEPIMARVQADVDAVRRKEKPDVVILAMHSGTGKGDGSIPEAEALVESIGNIVVGVHAASYRLHLNVREALRTCVILCRSEKPAPYTLTVILLKHAS